MNIVDFINMHHGDDIAFYKTYVEFTDKHNKEVDNYDLPEYIKGYIVMLTDIIIIKSHNLSSYQVYLTYKNLRDIFDDRMDILTSLFCSTDDSTYPIVSPDSSEIDYDRGNHCDQAVSSYDYELDPTMSDIMKDIHKSMLEFDNKVLEYLKEDIEEHKKHIREENNVSD